MSAPYRPISCSLYDHLEIRAMRGSVSTLRFSASALPDGADPAPEGATASRPPAATPAAVETRQARLVTLRARDGVEYLVLEGGEEIRLDRLLEVDGISFRTAPGCDPSSPGSGGGPASGAAESASRSR